MPLWIAEAALETSHPSPWLDVGSKLTTQISTAATTTTTAAHPAPRARLMTASRPTRASRLRLPATTPVATTTAVPPARRTIASRPTRTTASQP